jgi:hypothetical protein
MEIYLLDNSLQVEICYDASDCEFEDNILVRFLEDCPEDEKIFRHDETNIFLTADQALALAEDLIKSARASHAKEA